MIKVSRTEVNVVRPTYTQLSKPEAESRFHRSIHRLVDLYSGLMALALFEGIRDVPGTSQAFSFAKGIPSEFLTSLGSTEGAIWWFIALCSVLFPIFQGTLLYFDEAYLHRTAEIESRGKQPKFARDYFFFLTQAGLLLWLGALVSQANHDLFVVVYFALLILDVIWAIQAHGWHKPVKAWLWLNLATLAVSFLFVALKLANLWIGWQWLGGISMQLFVLIIAPVRGLVDYKVSWGEYFPSQSRS